MVLRNVHLKCSHQHGEQCSEGQAGVGDNELSDDRSTDSHDDTADITHTKKCIICANVFPTNHTKKIHLCTYTGDCTNMFQLFLIAIESTNIQR